MSNSMEVLASAHCMCMTLPCASLLPAPAPSVDQAAPRHKELATAKQHDAIKGWQSGVPGCCNGLKEEIMKDLHVVSAYDMQA